MGEPQVAGWAHVLKVAAGHLCGVAQRWGSAGGTPCVFNDPLQRDPRSGAFGAVGQADVVVPGFDRFRDFDFVPLTCHTPGHRRFGPLWSEGGCRVSWFTYICTKIKVSRVRR